MSTATGSFEVIFLCFLMGTMAPFLLSCRIQGDERLALTNHLERSVEKSRDVFFSEKLEDFQVESNYLANNVSSIKHPNQPMYLCERASFELLLNNPPEAERSLHDAINLLECFFDADSEKTAVSVWGNESDKVFKGEPYERAILYMLYSMCLMEKGDIDNALAGLRRAMLMDGDSTENAYKSDFGLLYLLAAKCYELWGEKEHRDEMLAFAVASYFDRSEVDGYAYVKKTLLQDVEAAYRSKKLPARLAMFFSWCDFESSHMKIIPQEQRSWLKACMPQEPDLDFDTVLVLWNGRGPTYSQTGEYKAFRKLDTFPVLTLDQKLARRACTPDGGDYDFFAEFGNVTYQAETRGGRKVERIQRDKVASKTMVKTSASFFQSEFWVAIPYLGLLFQLIGGGLADTQENMNIGADIRCWQCLPAEFTVAFLKLNSIGEHNVEVQTLGSWRSPIDRKNYTVTKKDSHVQFVHLFP